MNALKRYAYITLGTIATARTTLAEIEPGLDRIDDGLKGPNTGDPITTIQSFIKGLLTLLGLVMVAMALWGGWKILTSGSEDEGKEAGKKIIINAIIGVVVIFFAWTITNLVFNILSGDTISN
jgi:Type IV secretion system pilin